MDTYGSAIVLFILISFSAFFSASETSFSCVNKVRLRTAAESGDKRAVRALAIAEDYDRTLSVILIGNNIVNISASSVATVLGIRLFGTSGAAIATVATTLLILTFGEILPKSFAKEHADRLVLKFAGLLRVLIVILTPLAMFFVKLQSLALRVAGSGESPAMTEDELRTIIDTGEEEGVLDEQRSELMRSALQFDATTVQEVLTPRVDLVALDADDNPEDIRSTVIDERFSRIPVYEKDLDHIIGVLQTRDYLEALVGGRSADVRTMLTKAIYVHRTQPISLLLAQFKREQLHMAVVMDDYGGTMGIVTLEDLLEELVGEIYDEDEQAEVDITPVSDGVWRVSGDYAVDDLLETIGYRERGFDSESATVGGWAFECLGRIPQCGDSFDYNGINVRIDEMDDQRIEWVTVTYRAAPAE